MRTPYTRMYLHLVWATWDRLPLLTPDLEGQVYAALSEKCRHFQCVPLSLGGVSDHVHLLLRVHPTVAVATLVKELKGSTSHLITHAIVPGRVFRWQGAYGAFTVGSDGIPALCAYIASQKDHHAYGRVMPEWEITAIEDAADGPGD